MTHSQPLHTASPRRRQAELHGRMAENCVAANWAARGYNILARRLRTGQGEIDLVVADHETLIFIEVKARRSLLDAAYSLLPRQQQRLLGAAEAALASHQEWQRPAIRFDVALVCHNNIEHIEDAIRYH